MVSPRVSQSAPPAGRRQRRSAELRRRIFDAALRLFAERGYAATTVEAITEAADVGKGTFFLHFPSKEHVLVAFGAMQQGKYEEALAAARAGRPVRGVLRHLMHALPPKSPGPLLARNMLAAFLTAESARSLVAEVLGRSRHMAEEILELGQERGEVRRDLRAADLALLFQQAVLGCALRWALSGEGDLKPLLDKAFQHYWSAVRSPRSQS